MKKLITVCIISFTLAACNLGNTKYTYPEPPDELKMKRIGSFANRSEEEGVVLFDIY